MDFKNAINNTAPDMKDEKLIDLDLGEDVVSYTPERELHGRSYGRFMVLPEDDPLHIPLSGEEWMQEYHDEVQDHFLTLMQILRVHFPGRKINKRGQLYQDFLQLSYDTSSRSR
jgi:hypothetical protein